MKTHLMTSSLSQPRVYNHALAIILS